MNIALTGIHSIICFQAFSEKNLGEDMLSLCELFNVSAQRVVIAFGLQQKEGSVAQWITHCTFEESSSDLKVVGLSSTRVKCLMLLWLFSTISLG